MEYLLFWPLDVLCLIISPVMLTMLLAALLKSDLLTKGSLSKDKRRRFFCIFQMLLYICPPEKMFCALIKGHLETLHYFISLCFGSSCAKMCIKMWEGGGVRESVFSVVTVLSL